MFRVFLQPDRKGRGERLFDLSIRIRIVYFCRFIVYSFGIKLVYLISHRLKNRFLKVSNCIWTLFYQYIDAYSPRNLLLQGLWFLSTERRKLLSVQCLITIRYCKPCQSSVTVCIQARLHNAFCRYFFVSSHLALPGCYFYTAYTFYVVL